MVQTISGLSERERLLALLQKYEDEPSLAPVLSDIAHVRRLMELYSFRRTDAAECFCDETFSRYRRDIRLVYGSLGSPTKYSSSAYLRLEQLFDALLRVAALRLLDAGRLSVSHRVLRESNGLLLRALQTPPQNAVIPLGAGQASVPPV